MWPWVCIRDDNHKDFITFFQAIAPTLADMSVELYSFDHCRLLTEWNRQEELSQNSQGHLDYLPEMSKPRRRAGGRRGKIAEELERLEAEIMANTEEPFVYRAPANSAGDPNTVQPPLEPVQF